MPVLSRRRLALELHRHRVLAGLTATEVAQKMDCSASKISRIETGRVPILPRDARDLARIYGLAADQQEQLAQLARESRRKGWWEAYADILHPEHVRYLGLESAATQLRTFEVGVVPGFLQVPAYTQAIAEAGMTDVPGPEAARLVQMEKSRQSVVTRRHPATLMAVVDEAAIRRRVGRPGVMRAQLRHLLAVARAPHVTFQVLPFTVGACPSIGRPFVLLSFSDPADDDLAFVGDQVTAVCIDETSRTREYRQLFDRLSQTALTPHCSATLVSAVLDDLS